MHPELGLPEVRKLWQTEGLFSEHYLKARLQKNSWWPSDAEAEPIWQFCKELYEKRYLACAKNNEAFTRQELLDKILEKLGFAWTDNLGLPDQDAEPDYILFGSAEEKEKVIEAGKQQRYAASVGILEAKKVNHPLSQISKHQGRYPHQQIRDYLNEAQVLTWSILTNGNEWRLYACDAKPSQFFGLNFEVAIKSLADFKVFLALFSAAAFARGAQGKCRLDQIREVALATQAELEADLRERIFTIVEILANGFAERPENGITDADLPRLYENCLIYLYRLLFILYAEGRLLLPIEPKSRKYYKQLSLARLLAPLKNFSEYDSQTQTRFYRDIHALCLVINGSDKVFNSAVGAYDLYILFFEQAVKLTHKGRLCSMITPNKFLSAPYAVGFRDYLCKNIKLIRLLNVSRVRVFDDPSIYPIVSVVENTVPTGSYEILVEAPQSLSSRAEATVFTQDSSNLTALPEKIWGFLLSESLPLVLKAQKISASLDECATVRASSTAAEADGYADALLGAPHAKTKKFFNTGLIDRYSSLWGVFPLTHKGRLIACPYLDLSNPHVPDERKAQYSKPKLVFAKMATRIEAFLDETGEYASANTNFAYDSKYDLHYLVALLNSKLMAELYAAYFGALRMSGGYFQFQAPQLRVLPIRQVEFTTPPAERKRLATKARALFESSLSTKADAILDFTETELAANRADVIHDFLAYLAGQMADLNKNKTTVRAFLTDLKDFHGIEVRSLTPKTKLDEFWKLETAGLFAHFQANKIRIKESDEEKIRARFLKAKDKLVPLDSQINSTDELIDQIVYRLYDLTEDEIKIVEGRNQVVATT